MSGLAPRLVPGTYTFHATTGAIPSAHVQAIVVEDEGTTVVLDLSEAERLGLEAHGRFAWITLDASTDLEEVGVTAAVATALASAGVACNVLAGLHHDHLLVPEERAGEAMALLAGLTRP